MRRSRAGCCCCSGAVGHAGRGRGLRRRQGCRLGTEPGGSAEARERVLQLAACEAAALLGLQQFRRSPSRISTRSRLSEACGASSFFLHFSCSALPDGSALSSPPPLRAQSGSCLDRFFSTQQTGGAVQYAQLARACARRAVEGPQHGTASPWRDADRDRIGSLPSASVSRRRSRHPYDATRTRTPAGVRRRRTRLEQLKTVSEDVASPETPGDSRVSGVAAGGCLLF